MKKLLLQITSGWLSAWGLGSLMVAACQGQVSWWLVVVVLVGAIAFTTYSFYEFSQALDAAYANCAEHQKKTREKCAEQVRQAYAQCEANHRAAPRV